MRERRPEDSTYYEDRLAMFSQGDLFVDVPLAFPGVADEIVDGWEEPHGTRRFLSGPFDPGHAILTTPTCCMRAQGGGEAAVYAHPNRSFVPVRPLEMLVERKFFTPDQLGLLRSYDDLINFMLIPANPAVDLPESVALLYMPVTLHHDMIANQRITQLALEGARQFQRKIVWFFSGIQAPREDFSPPMD